MCVKSKLWSFIFTLVYKNIDSIPTNDSPYITVEMYRACKTSLFILAKRLREYYENQDDNNLEWLYYWVQCKIEGATMLINIFSCAFIPVCVGICTLWKIAPLLLLLGYFIMMLYYILNQYIAKLYYEFHMRIIENEYEKRK